jgi:glycosidase
MQWDNGVQAGFSTAKPWLPVNPDYIHRNVLAQQADPASLFHFTKKLLGLRKEYPALRHGDYLPLETGPDTLAYVRSTPGQSVLVAINFKNRLSEYASQPGNWQILFSSQVDSTHPAANLSPYEVRLLIGE